MSNMKQEYAKNILDFINRNSIYGISVPDNSNTNKVLSDDQIKQIAENYYIASAALMNICTMANIPDELKRLAVDASSKTVKIIDYINEVKGNK